MFQNFFLVWTVAFNFVPLGVYTREHTDILIAINMLGIFAGLFAGTDFIDFTSNVLFNNLVGNKIADVIRFYRLFGK